MPPKRRKTTRSSPAAPAAPKRSKIARENDLTANEEAEIKEAFHLFSLSGSETGVRGFEDEKEGVIPTADVRRALIALGLAPSHKEELKEIVATLDPDSEGYVPYGNFLSVCALKMHSRTDETVSDEISAAYSLFTAGGNGPITMAHLRRIARDLKENVTDGQLSDMILEANGGAGVSRGVREKEFEDVMRRAGVFG
ncbi:MAG: hypothetical protein M1824_001871 [Vezdaea acicularis]|nr:MAG: hypothetical protein M1824_001871 [Vezdaea acicularis]